MTTAVDKWPAAAKLVAVRCGGPLTHSSYTTPGDAIVGFSRKTRCRAGFEVLPQRICTLPLPRQNFALKRDYSVA